MAINAAHIAAYKMPALEGLEAGDRYDALDNIISNAEEDKVFPSISSQKGDRNLMHESRITVLRNRLFLLGYLKKDSKSVEWDRELAEAVQAFQAEANLQQTEELDIHTWDALQQMVSFEHRIELERWYEEDTPVPALLRAISLRLFVFGLLNQKMSPQGRKLKKQERLENKAAKKEKKRKKFQKKIEDLQEESDDAIQKGLDNFAELSSFLNLADHTLSLSGSFSFPQLTVQALFDQDRILSGISKAWNGHAFNLERPESFDEEKTRERVKNFIICCAKVELWLHGYNAKPDGDPTYKMLEGNRETIDPISFPVFHALFSFWVDSGLSESAAWEKAKSIEGDFFQMVSEIQDEGQKVVLENPSEEVFKTIVDEEPTVIDKVWGDIKQIGSRIWDGLKRAWNWFKGLLKKVGRAIKKVAAWAKNLARLAYKYAMNVFPAIKQIVESVSASIKALINPIYPGSHSEVMVIHHDKDFDFTLLVNPASSREAQKALLKDFQRHTILVRFGFQIMGLLIGTIIDLVKKILTAGGWFGLILALVKTFSRLRELKVVLEDERVLLSQF